ncbi:hypothetical protein [Jiangella sp. DSM 45060]|uniref:hypothetical protein n=1 Tax=Jiangella sp. DSM 45060 TaxID=1798224 RepID=UPI00087AB2B9|nr:hypothetical protein [Jiangella sp. DSM 45060]SDT45391.1 hypothetical protein SAMN04515669_4131 [Jiangella sp. DSM 45060]
MLSIDAGPSTARPRTPLIHGIMAVILVGLLSTMALPAEADQPASSPAAGEVGTSSWTPGLSPFYSATERVWRGQDGPQRRSLLEACPLSYLCLATGEGNGRHTVYWLRECPERSIWNFIDAGAVVNHQTGGAVAGFRYQSHSLYWALGPNNVIHSIDWKPVWYVDPC